MELPPLYAIGFAVGTTLLLLALFSLGRKGFAEGNSARHLLDVGEVLGVFMVAAAVVKNCVRGEDLGADLLAASSFGVLGIVLGAGVGGPGQQLLLARTPR